MSEDKGKALSWDSEIEKESEFTPILPGEYPFTVVNIEKGMFNGSEKMEPCPIANVTLRLNVNGDSREIKDSIFLSTKSEWRISQFFIAIGLKKKGEKVRMNWAGSIGKSGRLKTKTETYQGREYVKVESYLEPDSAPAASAGFAPPSFR